MGWTPFAATVNNCQVGVGVATRQRSVCGVGSRQRVGTAREQACDEKAEEWLTLAHEQAGRGAARAPSRRAASAAEERKHAGDKQAEECSRVGGEQAKERQPAAGYASHGGAR
uniref:Uncharacterized protein n=1 Tax=Oryza sativa subsp. japonica TaxID=39947 RepID=Q67WN1_ORYSJ|nr:hypothetical protein [Oryza sativa Japonica Group]